MNNQKILDAIEEKNLIIKDLNLKQIIPNLIEGVIVTLVDEKLQLHMPSDMLEEKYQIWKKGRGGVFVKDIKNKEKNFHYVILSGEGIRIIARLIEEDEIERFNDLKLIDGKINNKPYMKLKIVREGEKMIKTSRYIEKNDKMVQEPKIIITNHIASNEDSDNHGNISLFKD